MTLVPSSNIDRPPDRLRIPSEHQQQQLITFIASCADPVLKSHLEDLNYEAVPVMRKLDAALGWQDLYMAVRLGTLFYGNSYQAVKTLTGACAELPSDYRPIELAGCSVAKCVAQTDKAHFALTLTTAQVGGAWLTCMADAGLIALQGRACFALTHSAGCRAALVCR
jgi:hypothetical protein